MYKIKRFFYWLFNDPKALGKFLWIKSGKYLPDKLYLKVLYRIHMGYWMDFNHPVTYTEKIQWLKLYDRKEEYTKMVDKYSAKEYAASIIGQNYVIPTIAVYNKVSEINWKELPNSFVLKTTNGGGGQCVYICKDKSCMNIDNVKNGLVQSLKMDIYSDYREWPYKGVQPRIIAEQLLTSLNGDIKDYKFYCFHGEPKLLLVAGNRYSTHNFNYFNIQFEPLDITSVCGPQAEMPIAKPKNYDTMLSLVKMLAKDIPHVRIDMYNCDGKIYFGEFTFYDSSGFDDMQSDEWNKRLGEWIKLPTK